VLDAPQAGRVMLQVLVVPAALGSGIMFKALDP